MLLFAKFSKVHLMFVKFGDFDAKSRSAKDEDLPDRYLWQSLTLKPMHAMGMVAWKLSHPEERLILYYSTYASKDRDSRRLQIILA